MMRAKVLIVHDQPELLEKVKNALSCETVATASSIQEAIAALKELEQAHLDVMPLDLVLCNVHIDPSHGTFTVFDLLKWIRGNPQIKEVPFLLVSFEPGPTAQYLVDSIRLAGASLGASGYVVMEQFEPETFVELVGKYLPMSPDALKGPTRDGDELQNFFANRVTHD